MGTIRVILALLFLPLAAFGQTRGLTATPSGANGTLLWPTGTLTLPGGIELTTPVDYDDGGTGATTQAAARINLGGAKSFASGAALQAGSADYAGQLCFVTDGISFSIARSTSAGETDNDVVCLNNQVYFNALAVTNLSSLGRISAITHDANYHYFSTWATSFVDNVAYFQARHADSHSTIVFGRSTESFPGSCALGIGNSGTLYPDEFYIETNYPPDGATSVPAPDITISQYYDSNGGGARRHMRAMFDSGNRDTTLYGWSDGATLGPTAIYINPSGAVGLGTSSLATGAQATVASGGIGYAGTGLGDTAVNLLHSLSILHLRDEFLSGQWSDTNIGSLGWRANTIGAAGTHATIAPGTDNWGGVLITSSNVAGRAEGIALVPDGGGGANYPIRNLNLATNWSMKVRFALNQTTDTRFYIGFSGDTTGILPAAGIFFRYDTNRGDANFTAECRSASTSTSTSMAVAADTSDHTIRIYSTSAGTISFSLDGATAITIATNVPSAQVAPILLIGTDAAASKAAKFYVFDFIRTGMSR